MSGRTTKVVECECFGEFVLKADCTGGYTEFFHNQHLMAGFSPQEARDLRDALIDLHPLSPTPSDVPLYSVQEVKLAASTNYNVVRATTQLVANVFTKPEADRIAELMNAAGED